MKSNSRKNRQKAKNTERQKNSFFKIISRKCRLESVLYKIMTTQEECIKYNFVAPLKLS